MALNQPKAVLGSIGLLLLSLLLGLAQVVLVIGVPQYATSYAIMLGFSAFVFALAFGLSKRSRFCRWFVITIWMLGALLGILAIGAVPQSQRFIYALQGVAQFGAAVLLLLPSSGRWFARAPTTIVPNAVV